MAQADSVPSPIQAPITGASSNPSTKRVLPVERYFVDQANTGGCRFGLSATQLPSYC